MNAFLDLLTTRHSIRKFLPVPVEKEKIDAVIQAALMAPAGKRSNPWEFILLENKETLELLSKSRPVGSQLLANAPMGIVVMADMNKSDTWIEDSSIASVLMQLEAHSLGLGSCWVQVRGRNMDESTTTENYIRRLLGIPSHFAILNMLAIGYPDEVRKPFDKEKLQYNKVHLEKY